MGAVSSSTLVPRSRRLCEKTPVSVTSDRSTSDVCRRTDPRWLATDGVALK